MKDFYEKYIETAESLIVMPESNQTFPTHFHNNIEILVVLNEKYEITVNAKRDIFDGCFIVFSDSYTLHGYKLLSEETGFCRSIIIPLSHQDNFRKFCGNKKPVSAVIQNSEAAHKIFNLVENLYYPYMPFYQSVSLSDMILSTVSEYLEYENEDIIKDSLLIIKILEYTDSHFKENITLKSISQAIGYRPEHISRVFHHYINKNIKEYINLQRYNELSRLISENPDSRLCDLIFEAGFSSLQSYYRFKNSL